MGRGKRQQAIYSSKEQHFKAGLSVRQEITYTDRLRDFFNGMLYPLVSQGFPEDPAANRYERRARGYTLADDKLIEDEAGNKALGITLAERGLTGKAAERFGVRWRPRDIGRVRGALANEFAGIRTRLGLPLGALTLTLNGAQRVGNWQTKGEGRCVALTPAADDPVAEYLRQADYRADCILQKEIRGYQRPEGAITHLTVIQFGTEVASKRIGAYAGQIGELVQAAPLTVELGRVVARGYDEQSAVIGYPSI